MMRSIPTVVRSGRPANELTARAGTQINAKIVGALCAVALSSAAIVAWKVQQPEREAVVLSPQSQAAPPGTSAPSLEQFPGLAASPSLPSVATVMPIGTVMPVATVMPVVSVVAAPAALVAPPPAVAAELNRARAESAAVAAGVSSVPVSTWPVVTRAPNEVPPRSDMRYQVNTPPPR